MSAPRKTIGIVGGAVSGSVFALHILSHPLLRQRYKPVIYEQLAPPASVENNTSATQAQATPPILHTAGASLGIFPNGLFPLFELGLREALEAISSQMEELQVWRGDLNGSHALYNTMRNQGWDSDLQSSVQVFERSRLRDTLLARVSQLGGEIHWQKKVRQVKATEASRPSVQFEDGETAENDLLVGADGAWSPVRKFLLEARNSRTAAERWPATYSGIAGIYGVSSGPEMRGGLALKGGKIGWTLHMTEKALPERIERATVETTVPNDTLESKMVPGAFDPSYTASILRSYKGFYHPDYGTWGKVFDHAERIIHSPLRLEVWETDEIQWGNIALIGDAAHVLPPYTGQGTSFGIEDATVLANAILNHPPSPTNPSGFRAALGEYAKSRVTRAKKLLPLASWSAASLAPGPFMRWMRDLLLRMPVRDPKKSGPSWFEPTMSWLFGERFRVELRSENRYHYSPDELSSEKDPSKDACDSQ